MERWRHAEHGLVAGEPREREDSEHGGELAVGRACEDEDDGGEDGGLEGGGEVLLPDGLGLGGGREGREAERGKGKRQAEAREQSRREARDEGTRSGASEEKRGVDSGGERWFHQPALTSATTTSAFFGGSGGAYGGAG